MKELAEHIGILGYKDAFVGIAGETAEVIGFASRADDADFEIFSPCYMFQQVAHTAGTEHQKSLYAFFLEVYKVIKQPVTEIFKLRHAGLEKWSSHLCFVFHSFCGQNILVAPPA